MTSGKEDERLTLGADAMATEASGQSWARGSFHADLIKGSGPRLTVQTQGLLHQRLKAAGLILFLAFGLNLLRILWIRGSSRADWAVIDSAPLLGMYIVVLALLAALTGWLQIRRSLSLKVLRTLELVMMATVTVTVGIWQVAVYSTTASQGGLELLQAKMGQGLVAFIFLMLLYGFFIPNTWKRAAAVILPIGGIAILVRLVIRLQYPELVELASLDQATQSALTLFVTAASAVYGSHIVNTLRSEAFEARRLGQYQLVEKIGSGGMGEVWRARHRMLARPAAIKLIRPEMLGAQTPEMVEVVLRRFEREAQATATLNSPHSIMLYDFGTTDDGTFYYVMELLDGVDLETLVELFGPLPAARVIHLLSQACESLADAHHNGLIHRDIKPANLYVCRLGLVHDYVKVLDFGLVKAHSRPRSGSPLGRDPGGCLPRKQR